MTVTNKECKTCLRLFPLENFQKDVTKKDKLRPYCKQCTSSRRKQLLSKETIRKRNLEKNFGKGILDTYNKLFTQQGGVCAICRSPENGRYKHLSVDHCHDSGDIRGLLCNNCNRAIGLLKDNAELLKKAAEYVSKKQQ